MVGGDESDGVAPGQWGRDRSWLQRVVAGVSGSTAGVIWTQGWLRPRRQGAFLPIPPQLQFLREQRFKVVKWRGGREKRESLGEGGGNEWSFVFWLEVDARGTVMVVLHVCVCVCVRTCTHVCMPGTLLTPQNHAVGSHDQHHFSDGETEAQRGSEITPLVKEQRTGIQDHQTPAREQLS